MYNTKFILNNGTYIYPGYLDKEHRKKLKQQIDHASQKMKCGCKPESNLYYKISEDLKIYPEHNNYKHDFNCSRYRNEDGTTERKTAYIVDEETGTVTAYCTFNPKSFSINENEDIEQENKVPDEDSLDDLSELVIDQDDSIAPLIEAKEPKLSFPNLIRSLNVDAFTEKTVNDIRIKSKEDFSKFVYHRMKTIRISRMRKAIGELTLEQDGVRFIYFPFKDAIKKTEKGFTRSYIKIIGADGKEHSLFIFPETLTKELKKFKKNYGMVPNENTMIAGFQNLQKGKSTYRVLGRIHLFQVSDFGLYCRSQIEADTFNNLYKITLNHPDIRFWIPPEDDTIGAIIQIENHQKKVLLLFKSKKAQRIVINKNLHEALIIDAETSITYQMLLDTLSNQNEEMSYLEEENMEDV